MKENYDVTAFTIDSRSSSYETALARIRHALCAAFNEMNKVPKIIVIIMENDVINCINRAEPNKFTAKIFKTAIKWLMREVFRMDMTYRDVIPSKALKGGPPHYLYIVPTTHKNCKTNELRELFGQQLEIVGKEKADTNLSVMRLKQVWDSQDGNLFLKPQQRLTPEGKATYWKAVDRTIKFCDSLLEKKALKVAARTFNSLQEQRRANFRGRAFGRSMGNFHFGRRFEPQQQVQAPPSDTYFSD